jgi:cytochrome c peroxidase
MRGLLLLSVFLAALERPASGQIQKAALAPGSPAGASVPRPTIHRLTIDDLDHVARFPGGISALPAAPVPADNAETRAKISLGRALFFDKRLSYDSSISCATCHDPAKAFSDGRATSVGIHGMPLSRRAPSLLNAAYNSSQFWDGRVNSLEQQALVPILAVNEMGMPSREAVIARLQSIPGYTLRFRQAFGADISLHYAELALAAFERTLVTPDSPFDRYAKGDKEALTYPQKRGLLLFIGKAACSQCHNGTNFTDNKFHQLGLLPGERAGADPGRFIVSHLPSDRHAFKTPSLRNVVRQSHFMHDGSMTSLEQVIEFYEKGAGEGAKSKLLFKLKLTDAERQDLLAFLQALSGPMPEE